MGADAQNLQRGAERRAKYADLLEGDKCAGQFRKMRRGKELTVCEGEEFCTASGIGFYSEGGIMAPIFKGEFRA